ncbi:c-type cytochrome domain-containing protein [Haloferula sp. A504]|uniref:c-type cytochrome domain-containing protein n=1 Tax=Haloferula sp. A504 TaxID=3373601 RepID=UPI0031C21B27|nr:hypothetical protein [Verrucomicrobiaceae bacterium E54]
MHRLLPLIALALPAHGAGKVTYDEHVLPIFEQSCLNCHNPDKAKGGLDLSTYQGTMKGGSGGRIVEPGDTSSTLLAVVLRTAEPIMPPEGDAISKDHAATLRAWIEGGLLQNPGSKARQASKPKFDTSLREATADAHSGPPPMPRDLLLEPAVVAARPSPIRAMVASPRAPLLAVTSQRQVLLHDTRSHELVGVLPFPEGDPVSLAITPDGRYLIVGGGHPGKSGLTVSFDLISGERVLTAGREFDSVLSADLRPDLAAVATGSPSRLVKLWDTADGSQTAAIRKHTDWITSLDYSPDGILLASGDRNGGVWVWEALTGAEFHTLRGHQAAISSASFRSDSNLLATASEDGSVRFWEMNGGREVRKLDAHKGGVLAFTWAPDGRFATAGRERSAKIWKADFSPLQIISDLPDLATGLAIDPAGTKVFIGDYQGRIHVHRIADGAHVDTFHNNPPPIAIRRTEIAQALSGPDPEEAGRRTGLLRQQRRWYRAHLNLSSRTTRAAAAGIDTTAETEIASFRDKAEKVEALRAHLAERRTERSTLESPVANEDPAIADERRSVLELLDHRIESLIRELDVAASQLGDQRNAIDELIPRASDRYREASRLERLYHASGGTSD